MARRGIIHSAMTELTVVVLLLLVLLNVLGMIWGYALAATVVGIIVAVLVALSWIQSIVDERRRDKRYDDFLCPTCGQVHIHAMASELIEGGWHLRCACGAEYRNDHECIEVIEQGRVIRTLCWDGARWIEAARSEGGGG